MQWGPRGIYNWNSSCSNIFKVFYILFNNILAGVPGVAQVNTKCPLVSVYGALQAIVAIMLPHFCFQLNHIETGIPT